MIQRTFAIFLPLALLCACGAPPPEEAGGRSSGPAAETAAPEEVALPPRKPSSESARVWITSPADGEELTSPFAVEFGLEGMELRPAGIPGEYSGHHHLLVDTGLPRMDLPITTDSNHIHFGQGQTRVELSLEPGVHTLQLLLADNLHIPHDPPLISDILTITVKE